MKKLYLTFLIFIIAKMGAQPVISAAHAIQPGPVTYYGVDATQLSSLTPGPAGANVSWDFSQYTSTSSITQIRYDCPTGNTNCTDFALANKIIESAGGEGYSYHQYANNELITLGTKSITSGVTTYYNYTDPALELKFPITYLQTFTDTFAGHSTPASLTETGTQTVTVDAYGTLKTSLGTFPDVIRLKLERNSVSNTVGNPTANITFVGYTWVSSSYSGALLTIGFSETAIAGFPVVYGRALIYGKNTLTLGTEDVIATNNKVDIYPNPSSDHVNITNNEKITKIEMNNAEGKQIAAFKRADKIDISGFPSGIYFLTITFKDGKTQTRKIIRK